FFVWCYFLYGVVRLPDAARIYPDPWWWLTAALVVFSPFLGCWVAVAVRANRSRVAERVAAGLVLGTMIGSVMALMGMAAMASHWEQATPLSARERAQLEARRQRDKEDWSAIVELWEQPEGRKWLREEYEKRRVQKERPQPRGGAGP